MLKIFFSSNNSYVIPHVSQSFLIDVNVFSGSTNGWDSSGYNLSHKNWHFITRVLFCTCGLQQAMACVNLSSEFSRVCVLAHRSGSSALTFRNFVPRLERLTVFRDFRKSLKMCKMNHFSLFCKSCSVLFLTLTMALRLYAAPPQIYEFFKM